MISYIEKGLGMFAEIERHGHWLRQVDGHWQASDDDAVQAIIDAYDPLPGETEKKLAELSEKCRDAIVSGFTSDALGSVHAYDGGIEDQLNIMGAAMSQAAIPFRCRADGDDVKKFVTHTAQQMAKVYSDGVTYKLTQLAKLEALRMMVSNAATVDEVRAVVW